jgi:hypothetical protein
MTLLNDLCCMTTYVVYAVILMVRQYPAVATNNCEVDVHAVLRRRCCGWPVIQSRGTNIATFLVQRTFLLGHASGLSLIATWLLRAGPFAWPFIGNLLPIITIQLHTYFMQLREKHGPIFVVPSPALAFDLPLL